MTVDLLDMLTLLYAGSGIATNLLYGPQLWRLWQDAASRRSLVLSTWLGWLLLDVVTVAYAALVDGHVEVLLVALANTLAQGLVVGFIVYQRIADRIARHAAEAAPARSALPAPFGVAQVAQRPLLYVGAAGAKGLGLFTVRRFEPGEAIVRDDDGTYYDGAITAAQAAARGHDLVQTCFQIDDDRYLEPRGVVDDFINHACSPNAGIRLTPSGYELIALRPILPQEEITYDYSTYISRHGREVLDCRCGSPHCRGRVSAFVELPRARQVAYLEQNVVAPFAVRELALAEQGTGWSGQGIT